MKQFVRYCLAFSFLPLAGSPTTNLRAQFYSVQFNTLRLVATTLSVEGSTSLGKHWTPSMSVSYNPWNFSDTKEIKHLLIEPGARHWFWQPYARNFISMYAMGARLNVAQDKVFDYRYQGWGYGAGTTYGRSRLPSKRWNMEVEVELGLLVIPYTKYRCEYCGDKVKSGTYFLLTPKVAFNFVYSF